MIFRAKRDRPFLIILSAVILFHILVGVAIALLLKEHVSPADMLVLGSLFALSALFILWSAYDIKYVFCEDHLLLKSGPFRCRIPYDHITGAKPVTFTTFDFLAGFRMMSAKEGILLTYRSGLMGEVKISPRNAESFLAELEKRRSRQE